MKDISISFSYGALFVAGVYVWKIAKKCLLSSLIIKVHKFPFRSIYGKLGTVMLITILTMMYECGQDRHESI